MPYWESDRNSDWDPHTNPDLVDRLESPQTHEDWALVDRYNMGDNNLRTAYSRQAQARASGPSASFLFWLTFVVIFVILLLIAAVISSLFS